MTLAIHNRIIATQETSNRVVRRERIHAKFPFYIHNSWQMRNVGNCARVTPRSRRSTFTFLKKGRGESHPLLFHPLPLRLADDSCESATERFTQLPQRRWNDAQVRGRKRCRYHCSNCGLYCLERNVASSNYPPVLLLEPRWVITVNGSVFVLLKDYTCVYVCEMEKGRRNYYLYR